MKKEKEKKEKKQGFINLLSKLMIYIRPHKTYFFLSILFDLINIGVYMIVPIFSGYAIDAMVGAGAVDFHLLYQCLAVILVITVTTSIASWISGYLMNVLTYKTGQGMRNAIYKKLNTIPIRYVDNNSHGDIMNTMVADVENVMDGFVEGFKTIVCGIFQILIVGILMFALNVVMALVVVVLAPMSLVLAIVVTKKSKKLYKERVNVQGELSGFAEEKITGMKIIKAFNDEDQTVEQFSGINDRLAESSKKAMFYAFLAHPTARLVNGILYCAVTMSGAILAIKGMVRIGKISSFMSYSESFTSPFNDITSIFADLNVAIASADRVFKLLDEKDEPADKNMPNLQKCNGEVILTNVKFSYEPTYSLIENLNLTVHQGQRVAIVGPTGCGKSTIINLLMRFYDVNSGSIKITNRDLRRVKRNSFRRYYGMVLQESWLYNASVRDNVAYGKPDATMDEIIEACKMANAHSFIEKLPQGYDTIISERGDNISAGQKQLLCIARVMLLKPPMMILDEATSNIDTRTEMKIQEALNIIMEGRTCFIVAHRLSTIENADVILVMNKGKIVEQGKHAELLEKHGFYYELFTSQFGT